MGVTKPRGRTSLTKEKEGKKRVSSALKAGTKSGKPAKPGNGGDRATELAEGYLAQAQMSKEEKRAARRAELLAKQAQHTPDRPLGPAYSAAALASLPDHALSRSALRRRKRRRNQQLAGTAETGRMEDLHAGLDAIVEAAQPAAEEEAKIGAAPAAHAPTMTTRRRKALLAQESQRQKAVLGDLTRAANPWAALRQHAANSLAFDAGAQR